MAGLIQDSTINDTYGRSGAVVKKGGLTFSGGKPFSHISNRNQTSRKKQNRKPSVVTEQLFHEKDIAYEIDPHNHEECIRAKHQAKAMEMDDSLKFVGLANGCSKELPSFKRPDTPPMFPPRLLEEMLNQPISDQSAKKFDFSLPESPSHYY